MKLFAQLTRKLIFSEKNGEESPTKPSRYKRMWRNTVFAVAAVSIVPLLAMALVNYYIYARTFKEESTHPIHRITSVTKHSLESFLLERIAAARYIVSRESFLTLKDSKKLDLIFKQMKKAFGGIVDLGIINSQGVMISYAGPYDLLGKKYTNQAWFNKVYLRDLYVSDVFLGHRKVPHFILSLKGESQKGKPYIFRATIDMEVLYHQIQAAGLKQTSDAFILNRRGVLQTPSRFFGAALTRFPAVTPAYADGTEIVENYTVKGKNYILGYSYIRHSPFVFLILVDRSEMMEGWITAAIEIVGFMSVSVLAVLIIIMGITSNWVTRIKNADLRREATLHKIEHTNKMASIGRLAAGVAHEINNPLAIINEKAGLIKDILGFTDEMPHQDKLNRQVDSILQSVERCSAITHRLLGFARHMDVRHEPLALHVLIQDVLGFLEKEAAYRDITINMNTPEILPTITSDKSQLQQLFLNIINNAFDAMKKGGQLDITIHSTHDEEIAVTITDNGVGIPKEDLERIFEPFFTTKETKGTGLGLSICYGIVKKVKGRMTVDSEVGKGTSFTIYLPVNPQ